MLMNRFLSRLTGSDPMLVVASGLVSGISCKNNCHLTIGSYNCQTVQLLYFHLILKIHNVKLRNVCDWDNN